MKIAVMGAGAVGCFFGGLLARAGHEVTLIARPVHVAAIHEHGLILETSTGRQTVALQATAEPAGVAGAELVLFCVKSPDTEAAGRAMLPHLSPDASIWSLQNGVDNAGRLQAAIGREVVPTVVYVAVEMAGPGHVRHHGRGDLVAGPAPRTAAIAERLVAAGIPVVVSARVHDALFAKLIVNCAVNALSAIAQLPYGRLMATPDMRRVMQDVVAECVAVGGATGVDVAADSWQAVEKVVAAMPGQMSSTAQDLAKGKPTEIDHLNGYVVAKGEALGVPTPVNRTLTALVRMMETRAG